MELLNCYITSNLNEIRNGIEWNKKLTITTFVCFPNSVYEMPRTIVDRDRIFTKLFQINLFVIDHYFFGFAILCCVINDLTLRHYHLREGSAWVPIDGLRNAMFNC